MAVGTWHRGAMFPWLRGVTPAEGGMSSVLWSWWFPSQERTFPKGELLEELWGGALGMDLHCHVGS